MGRMRIVQPWPVATFGTVDPDGGNNLLVGPERVGTADPREAAVAPTAGRAALTVDLGTERQIDTVFIGYVNFGETLRVAGFNGAGGQTLNELMPVLPNDGIGPFHRVLSLPAMRAVRYMQIMPDQAWPAGSSIGVFAAGQGWTPTWGAEWGAGRPLNDTSTVERLFGGGFGIDRGVVTGGYQWTFGDLQPGEVRYLYARMRQLGTTRSFLLVEDDEISDGLNERIHWCLFAKLNTYERANPKDTKWQFEVRDWA